MTDNPWSTPPSTGEYEPLPTSYGQSGGQFAAPQHSQNMGWNQSYGPQQSPYSPELNFSQPTAISPRPRKGGARKLLVAIGLSVAMVLGAVGGGYWMHVQRNDSNDELMGGPSPEEVTAEYLDAVIARDVKSAIALKHYLSHDDDSNGGTSPIVGAQAVADAIDLKVTYEIIMTAMESSYRNSLWTPHSPDDAEVLVKFSYSMTVNGKAVNAWALQIVELNKSRAVLDYDQNDHVEFISAGPRWEVDSVGRYSSGFDGSELDEVAKDMGTSGSDYLEPSTGAACMDPPEIVVEFSDQMWSGDTFTECAIADAPAIANDETLNFLKENMLPTHVSAIENVLTVDPIRTNDTFSESPISQLACTVGGRDFVFTFLIVGDQESVHEGTASYSLINIAERTMS